jgi:hypothetical protein
MTSETVRRLSHQSWTSANLCVDSFHEDIQYYTCRWDALCPYIDVNPDLLSNAKKPFIVYALPPDGPYGVPINDKYGLVDVQAPDFWTDTLRAHKFKKLDNAFKRFHISEHVMAGKDLSLEQLFHLGGQHFSAYEIHDQEVAGFIDYIQDLDILIIQVHDINGDLVLTDVSILLPERQQVYGSFCQWNYDYKNRSPGIYACLLVTRWTHRNGYRYYNLGPVGDYSYKELFVTDLEPIYAIALTDPNHPLALDTTSPLHTDFTPDVWNQIYRAPSD